MSSSSATATGSRSPSPDTPESSDSPNNSIVIQNDLDLPSWYQSLHPEKPTFNGPAWDNDVNNQMAKNEEQAMLHFDDLIEEHAYDDSPYLGFDSSPLFTTSVELKSEASVGQLPALQTPTQSMHASDLLIPSAAPLSGTKPIPPPAVRPRKRESFAAFQRVVYPLKESCYNLPIMVPSIPEGGTKSRVETQVRVTVDLAHASSSSGEPFKYDRVGSWKWLKLPAGTATKKRTRKEGKIDPIPQDILYLGATVSCASPPHNPVLSCNSCQSREAKRVARKLAARVRPARSDSDSPEDGNNFSSKGKQEDTSSIVQFNCPEVLDFTTGSVVLPLRITCYCRHHREKVGFNVHFTMMDHTGRIVGAGTSRPIMITDDHKTVNANKQGPVTSNGVPEPDIDWSQFAQIGESVDVKAPSKRKQGKELGQSKKRVKPYDTSSRITSARVSREASVVSLTSPASSSPSIPHTRSPTPAHFFGTGPLTPMQDTLSEQSCIAGSALVASPSDTMNHQTDQLPMFDMNIPATQQLDAASPVAEQLAAIASPDTRYSSRNGMPLGPAAPLVPGMMPPQPMPYMFFDPGSPPPMSSLPLPKIHRLIPAAGPTYGGIEVTVLGANFHPAMTLSCVFGDTVASSTQRWSDNTLVCVLPPRASPGVVAVWFDGVQKDNDSSPPCLFTYTDESDRALMELALQVVGLKMTGKIEEAKNVAMRIVGTSGADDSQGGGDANMMQLASSSYRDIRPLLLTRAGEGESFESVIVEFLSILEVPVEQSSTPISSAISHTTPNGQTLLHLACLLGFSSLAGVLIKHDIDLDARDRNGYTALHFAVLARSRECATLLVESGADLEIVNALGKTPKEQAAFGFFQDIISVSSDDSADTGDDEDDESRWGDAEEDEDDEIVPTPKRSSGRATRRRLEAQLAERINVSDDSSKSVPAYPKDEKLRLVAGDADEKQAASFVDMIQRTFAQLYAPQGIISNMPQLPLPHLPGMPNVPWGVLPQIPVIFPVFVPTPTWPSFLGERRDEDQSAGKDSHSEARTPTGSATIGASQEWRAMWEKWIALAMATTNLRQEEAPPPVYTPRSTADDLPAKPSQSSQSELEDEGESSSATVRPHAAMERPVARRFGYPSVALTNQDVNAYAYRPTKMQSKKLQKKNDRMLVYFWIPILLLSLIWALYTGARFAFHSLRTVLPLQAAIRA